MFAPPDLHISKKIKFGALKLQEEKQLKKEKRRQKKERRERREERKNKKEKTRPNSVKSDIVKGQIGQQVSLDHKVQFSKAKGHIGQQVSSDHKVKFSNARSEAKCEKLELSSVTQEYGYPNSLPGPTSSCESTENTSNRKKRASPEDDSNGHSKFHYPYLLDPAPQLILFNENN